MHLHLVGETIDKTRSHYLAETGKLVQLMQGIYLTGPRVQRTRIRALEIVQNKAPAKPALACATVADRLGEFAVNVSSIRQSLLEAFRLRSEHAAAIDAALAGLRHSDHTRLSPPRT